ncbi:MAG TPA: GNAT family N-acetyltransferase [Actinomycetota bacterium]
MKHSFPLRVRDGRTGIVRVARPRDARACLAIVAQAARERPRTLLVLDDEMWSPRLWRRHRRGWGPDGVSLVAELEGEVVGHLTADRGTRRAGRHAAEFGITVVGRARGLGVGRALLETLETWARDQQVTRIALGVFPDNERARSLYRSMGYQEEGLERSSVRFPEGDRDIVRMAKLLAWPDERAATMEITGETTEG